jgi:hypothetical protein
MRAQGSFLTGATGAEEAGVITNAFVFDVSAAGLTAIYVVRNPDKLTQLNSDR